MKSERVGMLTAGSAAALALLAGCQGLNRDTNPGPHVTLDTLHPTSDFYSRVDKEDEEVESSLRGISRENWDRKVVYVPVSGVEHKPIYTSDKPKRTMETARQRGEHPTQVSVLEGTNWDSTAEQSIEGVWAPFRAGWDILWLVPKMVVTPPWETVSSPRNGYQRDEHATSASNGGLKDGGLGVTLKPLSPYQTPAKTTPAGEPAAATPGIEPAPIPEQKEPGATTPRNPGGAIGGSDTTRRRQQQTPPKPAPKPDEPSYKPQPKPESEAETEPKDEPKAEPKPEPKQ